MCRSIDFVPGSQQEHRFRCRGRYPRDEDAAHKPDPATPIDSGLYGEPAGLSNLSDGHGLTGLKKRTQPPRLEGRGAADERVDHSTQQVVRPQRQHTNADHIWPRWTIKRLPNPTQGIWIGLRDHCDLVDGLHSRSGADVNCAASAAEHHPMTDTIAAHKWRSWSACWREPVRAAATTSRSTCRPVCPRCQPRRWCRWSPTCCPTRSATPTTSRPSRSSPDRRRLHVGQRLRRRPEPSRGPDPASVREVPQPRTGDRNPDLGLGLAICKGIAKSVRG